MSSRTILAGTGRVTGKTTRAIKLAYAFGATLIEPNQRQAALAKNMAADMRIYELKVESFQDYVGNRGHQSTPVVIDGADTILADMLQCNIAAMTIDASLLDERGCNGR